MQLNEQSWTQASLPIRFGGLGIRKISSVALPAFLSSVHSSANLISKILRAPPSNFEIAGLEEARNAFLIACPGQNFPVSPKSQRSWDDLNCKLTYDNLLSCSTDSARARLLASTEAGSDVNGCDIMVGISESFGMLEDLIGGGSEWQRLLQRVSQTQRQLQVLLHVCQRLMCRV
ncbi:hypothetical protein RR48_02485 [Papilio machaon]|uniref:Uncharacterized protein n=1 Tax=Papilio machaon TaxID=76193 RepID=A0A0N0PBT7_PAPMA|nr:hypothetical protein RR48_02485 [Papilio machaon]